MSDGDPPARPLRILTGDLLVIDEIARKNSALERLAAQYALPQDGKKVIGREQLAALLEVMGSDRTTCAGGSSANVMTTLSKLLGRTGVEITFLGVVGSQYRDLITKSLTDAGIRLVPPESGLSADVPPETAVSVVLVGKGKRSIATFPGNADRILKPEHVTQDLVHAHDALFVQGSLWQKFGAGFADRFIALRRSGQKLWLALPTQGRFSGDHRDMFWRIIAGANVVLANIGELARVAGIIGEEATEERISDEQRDNALATLQDTFRRGGKHPGRQMGFLTMGAKGAAIVTADAVIFVDPPPVTQDEIASTLGAGDTAYAGFLAGHIRGMNPEESAGLAMRLAGEKLKIVGPRLDDPKAALRAGGYEWA